MSGKYIIKNDGRKELLNPDKIHERTLLACENLNGVSPSEIEMSANLQIVNGTKSANIQDYLIKAAADLIDEENPNYQIVAARLLNQKIRKEVYGQYLPKDFYESVMSRIRKGYYDKYILDYYTKEEISYFGAKIKYSKDDKFTYAGLMQLYSKYLMKRRGKLIETPQEANMLINMYCFAKYPKEERKKWILEGYRCLSDFEVSLPTPIMIGLRSSFRRFISCNIIDAGDSTESLAQAAKSIMQLTASRSGLGLHAGWIRGLGAEIDNGRVIHTGVTPILQGYEKNTKMFTQEARNGSTTVYYPFFHIEIESILVLGNNKGTTDNRVRQMDHAIVYNKLLLERQANNEDITLFYINDVPDLLYAMGNYEEFKKLYENYENTIPEKRKKRVSAEDILRLYNSERFLQGRVYNMVADNTNQQGMWKLPVISSNLCAEITTIIKEIEGTSIKRNIKIPKSQVEEYYDARQKLFLAINKNDKKQYINKIKAMTSILYKEENEKDEENYHYTFDYFNPDETINLSEVGVCILAGLNLGQIGENRLPIASEYLVRFLEEMIDYMDYATPEVEKAAIMRRTIGIGFSDVFHLLAKEKVFYNTFEGRNLLHKTIEEATYYMYKTSIQLAKEKGPCILYRDTKYADGLFPIDTYKKTVDELVDIPLYMDWEALRIELKKYGIRHSTLTANAPYGNSAETSGSTSGMEPPRKLLSIKEDKKRYIKKLVPDYQKYKNYYTTTWGEDFNNIDYYKFVAVAQKFIDQAISLNQYTNLLKYPDQKVPMQVLFDELYTHYRYGLKTTYYQNFRTTNDADGLEEEQVGCGSGGCIV